MQTSVLLPTVIALLFAVGYDAFGLDTQPPAPPVAILLVALASLVPLVWERLSRNAAASRLRRALLALELMPLALYVLEVVVFAWPVTVARLGLERWPTLAVLVRLLPYGALRFTSEIAKAGLARSWFYVQQRPVGQALTRLRQESLFLVPLLIFAVFEGVLGIGRLETYAALVPGVHWAAVLLNLVLLLLFFPALICFAFGLKPIRGGEGRERMMPYLRKHGFQVRNVMVLPRSEHVHYAGLIGVFPASRYLAVSRGLLGLLSQSELEAVMAHEMGHGEHRHALQTVLSAITVLTAVYLAIEALARRSSPLATETSPFDTSSLLLLAGVLPVLWVAGRALMRRLEIEADFYAARLTGSTTGLVNSLEKMVVAGGLDPDRHGFRHPSVRTRQRLLAQVTGADPEFARRFARRMVSLRAAIAVAAVVALIALGRGVLADSSYGLAMVDLQEHRFAQASAHLESTLALQPAHAPSLLAAVEIDLQRGSDARPALERLLGQASAWSRAGREQVASALTELQAERLAAHDLVLGVDSLRRAVLTLQRASD
jgi:hypothetical protein